MPEKRNNTAILVFIRNPKHEAEEKVFAKHIGFRGNQKLAKKLNQRVIRLSRESGIPSFVFDSSKQSGFNFGERFVNALEAVFEKGFEKVIAIGNDCLSLSKKTLFQAETDLQKNDLVLGPTYDGGFYLIGISKKIFKSNTLVNFNWTTPYLADDFRAYIFKNRIAATYFETAIDIDSEKDIYSALKSLPKLFSLRRAIEEILSNSTPHTIVFCRAFIAPNFYNFSPLRAPPV